MTARLASLFSVAVAAGLAGAAFHRGFAVADIAGPVALAAVVPVVLAAVLARGNRRPPPLVVSVALSALVWLAVVESTLFRDGSPHAEGALAAVWDGVVNGAVRLLDTTLPAPGSPDLLIVPQALTWLAALAGMEVVTRTRAVTAPVLPAAVVFAVAVVFTVPGTGSNVGVAAGLVTVAGALALFRRADVAGPNVAGSAVFGAGRDGGAGWDGSGSGVAGRRSVPGRAGIDVRRAVIGASVVAVTTVVGVLAGPLLAAGGDSQPYDVREHRDVPQYPATTLSPLDYVSAWLGNPDQVLFRVTPPLSRNIRLAVLDQFDGERWTSSARYVPAGGRVPPAQDSFAVPAGGETRQEIEIVSLGGSFLPQLDRPVSLAGNGLAVDVRDGTLVTTDVQEGQAAQVSQAAQAAAPGGGAGRRYSVVSVAPPELGASGLASVRVAGGPDAAGTLHVPPGLPASLNTAAQAAAEGARSPFQQAYQIEQYLRSRFTYDPAAPAGHTYGHLAYFLGKSHTGTSEQFATSYAVFARVLGLPSRVVVGFSAPDVAGTPGAPVGGAGVDGAEAGDVRAGDVLVWPEVHFEGAGWVPFYPTPDASDAGGGEVATTAQGEPTDRAQRVAEAAAVPPAAVGASSPVPEIPTGTPTGVYIGIAVLGTVVTAAVGYLGTAVLAPVSRRRRRRSAGRDSRDGGRERVVGAWQDTLESLDYAGVTVSRATTPTEVAAQGLAVVGARVGEPLGGLAERATTALFAADPVPAAAADLAWRYAETVRAELRRATPVRRRVWRRVAPRRVLRRDGRTSRERATRHESGAVRRASGAVWPESGAVRRDGGAVG